jgi:hypothetical protein
VSDEVYQDALGNWVAWDGEQKLRGFASEGEALLSLKEATRMSAIQEWADQVRRLTTQAEALIDGTAPGKRIRVANGLDEQIARAGADEYVGDSDMKGARAQELLAMYNALEDWLATPLSEGGPMPIQVISRRE